jgi:asparagine synthetase B (glutamine-hydrolysing)
VLIKNENISTKESLIIHQSPVDLGSVKPQISMAKKLKEIGFYTTLTGDGADELFGGYKRSALYDSQFSDIFMELPYYHLPKLDRTMMRFTIESRSPFLSPKVISHALTIPHSKRNGEKKVLKELFKNDIPKIILNRDKKPLKNKHIEIDCTKQRILNNKTWKKLYVA